jgi:two-component sensor histidine kinase/ABC-type uncharacterized transport system substrate-binding protein
VRRPAILILTIVLTAVSVLGAQQRRVVVLHSYQHDFEWTILQHSGILFELENSGAGVQLKTEYFDSKRSWTEEKRRGLADYLRLQYRDFRADLVIVTDNDALSFMDEHGDGIFGRVPVVFAGVNEFDESMIASRRDLRTGVAEFVDYRNTLEAIRVLFPRVREIRMLGDESTTGRQTKADLAAAVAESGLPLAVKSFAAGSYESVLAEAASLSETTAVVLLPYSPDQAARPVSNLVGQLAAASPAPIFSLWDFYFGHGIIGGCLTSGFAQGREAGRMALSVLSGVSPRAIPVAELRRPELVFDWRVLKRFGLQDRGLPEGSVVKFRPQGLYERDPQTFAFVAAALGSLLVVIAGLSAALVLVLRARARLRGSERLLSASLAEQKALLKEVHHRVYNNFQVISSLLHLQGLDSEDAVREALVQSERRIRSMALVHESFYQNGSFADIDFMQYLSRLLELVRTGYPETAGRVAEEIVGGPLPLQLDAAVPLGLICNELLDNALRYAFPDGRRGTLRLACAAESGGGQMLVVSDDGIGIPAEIGLKGAGSLGFQLVDILERQANVAVELDRTAGSTFTIRFKN